MQWNEYYIYDWENGILSWRDILLGQESAVERRNKPYI